MAGGINNRAMLVGTEVAKEGVRAQDIEEYTQNRNTLDPVLVREREWIVDGTDDRFWVRLEIVVQQSCYYLPGSTLSISLLIEPGLEMIEARTGLGAPENGVPHRS